MPVKHSSRIVKRWTWPILIVIIFLLVTGLSFIPYQPQQYPDYIADSPSPTGVKAFYTFLDKNYEQVSLWKKPVQSLPDISTSQLMIIVEPGIQINEKELPVWIAWMEAGNSLWLLDSSPQDLFEVNTDVAGPESDPSFLTVLGKEEFKGQYQAFLESDDRLLTGSNDHVLLEDSKGVIALSRKYGDGELMVLLTPQWITNEAIVKQDHLKLLLPFIIRANPDVIWFNEYVHGSRNLIAMIGLYPTWYLIVLFQAALCLILWIWSKGKRFGSVRIPREWTVRFGDERVRALASWYESGDFYLESLASQEKYLRHIMKEQWGIAEKADDREIYDKAGNRIRKSAVNDWLNYWKEKKELTSCRKISSKKYLEWSKRFSFMQREVKHR